MPCNELETNPDISGIGVRLSFYIQSFILVLLVDRQSDASAVWTFIATSFGLTISAIVQAAQHQLSLLQALQVSNLVWLANFGTFLALASYSRGIAHRVSAEHHYVRFATMFQTVLSMILTFYMWCVCGKPSRTFDNQPECASDIRYVIFVINVPALGSGRIVGLIFSSLLTVGYLLITAHEMKSYLAHRRGNTSSDEKSPRTRPSRTPTTLTESAASTIPGTSRHSSLPLTVTFPETTHRRGTNDIIQITQTGSPDPQNTPRLSEISRSRRPRRRNWFADFDPMLLGITIFQILVFGYFIVSSELLRARNPSTQNDDGIWGFGQILALIVITPSLVSLLGAFQEHGFKRLRHRKKNRRRQKRRLTGVWSIINRL